MKALMIVGLVMVLFSTAAHSCYPCAFEEQGFQDDLQRFRAEQEWQSEVDASPRIDKCTRGSDRYTYERCQHLLLGRGCSQLSANMVVERLNSPESSTEDKKLVLALRTPSWQRTPDQQTLISIRNPLLMTQQKITEALCLSEFRGHEDELITELTTNPAEKAAAKARERIRQQQVDEQRQVRHNIEATQARAEQRDNCIRKGDTAAGNADAWGAAHPGAKQFTEVELRGLSDKVYGNCMGTPGVQSKNDNMELEPNRQGRFIARAESCGKQIDKDKIVGMDKRGAAFEQCMGKTFPVVSAVP